MMGFFNRRKQADRDMEDYGYTVPELTFEPTWRVRLLPPYGGALVRFEVRKSGGNHVVSVFFDAANRINQHGCEYWSVYEEENGGEHIFNRGEELVMLKCIRSLVNGNTFKGQGGAQK